MCGFHLTGCGVFVTECLSPPPSYYGIPVHFLVLTYEAIIRQLRELGLCLFFIVSIVSSPQCFELVCLLSVPSNNSLLGIN
jgi:hypothetical protein